MDEHLRKLRRLAESGDRNARTQLNQWMFRQNRSLELLNEMRATIQGFDVVPAHPRCMLRPLTLHPERGWIEPTETPCATCYVITKYALDSENQVDRTSIQPLIETFPDVYIDYIYETDENPIVIGAAPPIFLHNYISGIYPILWKVRIHDNLQSSSFDSVEWKIVKHLRGKIRWAIATDLNRPQVVQLLGLRISLQEGIDVLLPLLLGANCEIVSGNYRANPSDEELRSLERRSLNDELAHQQLHSMKHRLGRPIYQHKCQRCIYLGTHQRPEKKAESCYPPFFDYYFCPEANTGRKFYGELIARFSCQPDDIIVADAALLEAWPDTGYITHDILRVARERHLMP